MKKINFAVLIGAMVLLSAFTIYNTNWKINDNYNIHFVGTDIEGVFEKFKGEVAFDENELPTSKFSLLVEVESIVTGNWLKIATQKVINGLMQKNIQTLVLNLLNFLKLQLVILLRVY